MRNSTLRSSSLKGLHDLIAQCCPNLVSLGLTLALPKTTPDYSDYISKALFSLPSIRWLGICLTFSDKLGPAMADPKWNTPTPIHGRVFTNLIQNLPQLLTLIIDCEPPHDEPLYKNRRFHFESSTLESLDVGNLWNDAVVSVDCPSLRVFKCDGSRNGNGVLPATHQLPQQRFQSILHQMARHEVQNANLVATGQFMAAPHFQVPDQCKVILKNFLQWNEDESGGYEEFTKRVLEFANATYQTFEEE